MSSFIHLTRNENGVVPSRDDGKATSLLNQVFATARSRAGNSHVAVGIDRFKAEVDKRIDGFFKAPTWARDGSRIDATSAPGGTALSVGALRVVLAPLLEATRPATSALELFVSDSTSVPLGKNEISASRAWTFGEVKPWGGAGGDIPTIARTRAERTWKVAYYITSMVRDIFEDMVTGAAGVNEWALLAQGAVMVMEEFTNLRTWYGDDDTGLYGVLNYPWFTRISLNGPSGKAWSNDENLSGVVTEEYVKELVRFVTHSWTQAKGAVNFRPNRLIIGQTLANFLANTKVTYSATTTGSPPSLMADFLTRQTIITSMDQIVIAHELDNAYDSTLGISCIVLDRKDPFVISNILPGGGPQMLPIVPDGFTHTQCMFMAHGGIISRAAGAVTIGYVETTPA